MKHPAALGATICACSLLGACVGTPAKIEGTKGKAIALPLDGVYKATVRTPFLGPVSSIITAKPTKEGFIAKTREGTAWTLIGGVEGTLGPVFAPFVFPRGILFTWTSSLPTADKPGTGLYGVSGLRTMGVKTKLFAPDKPIEVSLQDGQRIALVIIEPIEPDAPPLRDYAALTEAAAETIERRLYDPELARSSSVKSYVERLRRNAGFVKDDIEFIAGAVLASRSFLKFTMPLVVPRPDAATETLFADWPAKDRTPSKLDFNDEDFIATLKVEAFFRPEDVDRVFTELLDHSPPVRGLILDLRSCPGVTLASLRAASWLLSSPADVGTFFGQAARAESLAGAKPAASVTIDSAAAVLALEQAIDERGAAFVRVEPASRPFDGPVIVLTTKRTSASTEPLVWLLTTTGRAAQVGQTTSGKPLTSRPYDIGQEWVMWLAAYDFTPAVGPRFNGKGLKPSFETSREAAPIVARKKLRELLGTDASGKNAATGSGKPLDEVLLPSR
ncbi:MAG: S41 family peptidase [Phycisphaerales bacterium]